MKRTILLFALTLCGGLVLAQPHKDGVQVEEPRIERNGQYMAVELTLKLNELKVEGNRAVVLTPHLVNAKDTVTLPSVAVYGRRRYYYYVRNHGTGMLTGRDETSYRAHKQPAEVHYSQLVPYREWMNGASLTLTRRDYGCCNRVLSQQSDSLGRYAEAVEFFPTLVYVQPKAEAVKSRSLEGSAYIDFPVDQTAIHPDYRRNSIELGKIRATIDSVRGDGDITITSVWLKGYASPESPYRHNEELAIGRTEALKRYIQQLYRFDEGLIATDYEAEDWTGLRRYVEQSDISNKRNILAIIDSEREPDNKEWKLKSTYPEEYRELKERCYPSLRHTDYRIAYTVRGYSDAEEIERVLHTRPQKLSLNELYVVAGKHEPGTEAFTEVFETAVRMYPDDETANLNAANAAMRRGDNAAAARYLSRAGNSAEAAYARGALAIRQEDYETARRYLTEARDRGLSQASATLAELDNGRRPQ